MNGKKILANLNTELENLFKSPDSDKCIKAIRKHLLMQFLLKRLKIPFILFVILCGIYYIPFLNWSASAIGRIFLIKCVLPFYDWEVWANARCLIDASGENDLEATDNSVYKRIYIEDCATCENLGEVERRSNISYRDIDNSYLRRSHPLIVVNSHLPWHEIHPGTDFIYFLYSNRDLKESLPCNILSNLITNPGSFGQLLKQIDFSQQDDKWFFQLRNCEFSAVKASRAIVPYEARPKFISQHLPSFRSSWILVSKNYEMKTTKSLNLNDLIVVIQLNGNITGHLQPNKICSATCNELDYHLNEGETMIFSSKMWNFSYRAQSKENKNKLIITFIQEIHLYSK